MNQVIINEQHTLMPEQEKIIQDCLGEFSLAKINANGINLQSMKSLLDTIKGDVLIFASPIPAMIKMAAQRGMKFYVLHNDNRDKVELPDGKIIYKVAETGWQLI